MKLSRIAGGTTDYGAIVSATIGCRRFSVHEPGQVYAAITAALRRLEAHGPIERGSVTISTPDTVLRDVQGYRSPLTERSTSRQGWAPPENTLLGKIGRHDLTVASDQRRAELGYARRLRRGA